MVSTLSSPSHQIHLLSVQYSHQRGRVKDVLTTPWIQASSSSNQFPNLEPMSRPPPRAAGAQSSRSNDGASSTPPLRHHHQQQRQEQAPQSHPQTIHNNPEDQNTTTPSSPSLTLTLLLTVLTLTFCIFALPSCLMRSLYLKHKDDPNWQRITLPEDRRLLHNKAAKRGSIAALVGLGLGVWCR